MEEPGDGPPTQGSQPPVRLPLASDSIGSQLDGSQAQVAVGSPTSASASARADEEDLFGSEADVPSSAAGAPEVSSQASPSASASGARPSGGESGADEEDLFGDAGDDAADLDERALFGSEDEGGADIDERALFGSDDEEGEAVAAGSKTPPKSPAASEFSEMDERDIFGDVSDDEPEKVEDVILRRRPVPSNDRIFWSMRLPNVLSIEKTAYSADAIPQSALEGYKEYHNIQKLKKSRLVNPENCVRWRFKKGPDGHNLTDEDGRPQYETNSRIVEWEDGSKTIYVGKESFDLTDIEDHVMLFEENSQDVHVCHGVIRTRLVATPKDLESRTHEMLKRSQFQSFELNRRSLLMSQEEQDAHQQLLEIQMDQKQRQRRDENRHKRSLDQGPEALTAAFLEEDDHGIGPSIKDIKDSAKKQRLG